jgi:hypothetical protein
MAGVRLSTSDAREEARVERVGRTVAAVAVGAVLLVIGLLALTGGLRLRSPVGAMNEELDRFELLPDETVVARTSVEDRVCFLQCIDRTVELSVERNVKNLVFREECEALAARLESWARASVTIEIGGRQPGRLNESECAIYVSASALGREDWRSVALIEWPGPAESQVASWTLSIAERS